MSYLDYWFTEYVYRSKLTLGNSNSALTYAMFEADRKMSHANIDVIVYV